MQIKIHLSEVEITSVELKFLFVKMLNYYKMTPCITLVALVIVIGSVISTPMYYKKTDDDTYEPGKIFELFVDDDSLNHK